ncbi:MAG: dockerin type I repeat-containing protein, partial [Oscillospiraceae bacterium]|nr:dockerin type I repeat-containing protein [Oscillospiraceae bacterium]
SGGEAVVCDSDAYEHAFWEGAIDTCEPQPDGTWIYAVAADPTKVQFASQIISDLYRGNAEGKEKLRTLRATWPTPDGSVYTTCYLVTDVYDGKIYYHTDTKIMAIPLEGGDAETVYTLTAEEKTLGSLYGMVISDSGLITYQIMPLPAFESEENYDSKAVFHTYQLPQQAPVVTTTVPVTTTEPETTTTEKVTTTTKAATTTTKATTTTTKATTTTTKATTTTTKVTTTTTKATTTTAKATTATAKATTTTTKATTTTTKTVTTTTKAVGTTTVSVTTTTETVTTTTTAKPVTVSKRGDLNLDQSVDVSDAVMLARLLVEDKKLVMTEQGMANADCDSDRKITPDDLTWILRFIAKLI